MRSVLLTLALLPATATSLLAQAPGLGYVYPAGAPAGGTLEVQLGGFDLTEDTEYLLLERKAKLQAGGTLGPYLVPGPPYWFGPKGFSTAMKLPREITARITLPADLPRGPIHWQVANANGSSGTAVFFVGDGPEVLEKHWRSEPQRLDSLPVTVNGRLETITEVDLYEFTATRDGPLTLDLYARRLGSDFHAVLQVRDAEGRLLADVADTLGRDCALTVAVRKGRLYQVRVFDLDFRGNRSFVYRLEVIPGPRVMACLPSGGKPGSTARVTLVGYGVATGAVVLESTTRMVTFPPPGSPQAVRGWIDYRLKTPHGTSPVVPLLVSRLNESVESPANQPPLAPGSAITGTLARPGETDRYRLEAKKGQAIRLEVRAGLIGTQLDPVLRVLGPDGKQLAVNDDLPGTLDAGLNFTPPADGTYTVAVSNGTGRDGTLAAVYRLTAVSPKPDFTLSMPSAIAVAVGGKATLLVTAVRTGGFAEEITLAVAGLPAGLSLSGAPKPIKIPKGKPSVKIELTAAGNSSTATAFVSVTGTAKVGEAMVTRIARAGLGGNLAPRDASAFKSDRLLVARTMASPVKLELIDRNRQRPVHRGTTYPAEFLVKRDTGFDGAIRLRMAATQSRHRQGIHGPIFPVPRGAGRVLYPCFMPEWLATDRTTRMSVQAVALVKDPSGKLRHLVKASDARITMILEGALLKLAHRAGELTVTPGSGFRVPVRVARSAKLRETVVIRLEVPGLLAGLLRCEPVKLPAAGSDAVLEVMTLPDARLRGDWKLKITATSLQDGRWPAVSQALVPVRFVK